MEVFKFGEGKVLMGIGACSVYDGPHIPSLVLHHSNMGEIRPGTKEETKEYNREQPKPDAVLQFPSRESIDNVIGMLTKLRADFN